jgi:osmotically-inducible protein OsmY
MQQFVDTSAMRKGILDELRWDASVDATRIDLHFIETVAVLKGAVRTYAAKCRAEEIVKRMPGVSGVRNRIEVRITIGDYRTDSTLERVAREVLECLARLPEERPVASVASAWVTLEGTVDWAFQKRLAEESIRTIAGVKGITNQIHIKPRQEPSEDLEAMIAAAFRRHSIDPETIAITARRGRVTVRGTVHSCAERDQLLDLAWCAGGVHSVVDRVVVR